MLTQLLNWFGIQVFAVLATTVLARGKGLSMADSLEMLIIANIVGAIGYLSLGWVGDRIGRRETICGALLLSGVSFTCLLLFADGTVAMIVCYSLGLGFMNGLAAPLFSYFSETYPTQMRGTAVAFINALGPVGAILGAAAFASLSARFDIVTSAFITGAVALFLAAVTVLGGYRVKPGTVLEDIAK